MLVTWPIMAPFPMIQKRYIRFILFFMEFNIQILLKVDDCAIFFVSPQWLLDITEKFVELVSSLSIIVRLYFVKIFILIIISAKRIGPPNNIESGGSGI